MALIGSDINPISTQKIILHEITHTLGLFGHTSNEDSVLYGELLKNSEFSVVDSDVLMLLYHPTIKTAYDQEDVRDRSLIRN